ncbi:hypothetical protein [Halobacillus litoralis]|uniref:hypothetical protein n=1 Tax=Halobacillus litoralis TaxID=45668 RepID=UPI001368E808|nr:hypothetical protein [Halobacillus litoralis]MYL36179.1 hypothetical protein [Halobacillus litoralis]
MSWFFPVMFLFTFGISYIILKKETTNGSLSRKGFYQIAAFLVIIFLLAFVPASWSV